ncbi:Ribose-phosphate pyrophosphokinase A [Diplonema papillatum]|nr:Ribose-phosphate pyrophosphokinase A [Diplonema papillatum]
MPNGIEDETKFKDTFYYNERKNKAVETTYRMRVLCGRANQELASDICTILRLSLTPAKVDQFANGEVSIKVEQNVRGDDCFIIQPTCDNREGVDVNTSLMELLLLVHTLRLSSAKRITAIVPYFAYARQDRKTRPRVPISASCVAQLLMGMGVDRVITVDLHCGQIQGFFHNTPVDNLPVHAEWARYILKRVVEKEDIKDPSEELTIVAPDAGGVERAMLVADRVGAKAVVTILKRRTEANKVERMEMVGDVEGQVCVIIDDICDTGGTLCKACDLLKSKGARAVYACITHGILTDPCLDRINECDALVEFVTTDTLRNESCKQRCPKLTVINIAPLLAEAIERTHKETSISAICNMR